MSTVKPVIGARATAPIAGALCAFALLLASCGDSGPSGPDGGSEGSPAVRSVVVTPSADEIEALGGTAEFSATARDADGNVVQGPGFEWSSTDEDVVTVDAGGVATAVANGEVTVRATTGDVAGEADLVVRQVATGMTIEPADATLDSVGDTLRFTANSTDANDHPVEEATYAWSSSTDSVVTVDASGLATAQGEGKAEIVVTAEPGDISRSVELRVQAPSGTIGLSRTEASLQVPEDGADVVVRWIEVSNEGEGPLTDLSTRVDYGMGQPTGWLSATLSATTAPASLRLTADKGALQVGSYDATVVVSSSVADNSPQAIDVELHVVRSPASYTGTYELSPVVHMTCPVPTGLDAYDEIYLESLQITDASLDSLSLHLDLRLEGLGSRSVQAAASLDPVTQAFAAAVPISFELSGTGYSVTGEGSLSLEGTFSGADRFTGSLDMSLDLTTEFAGFPQSDGTCSEASTDVTGTRVAS